MRRSLFALPALVLLALAAGCSGPGQMPDVRPTPAGGASEALPLAPADVVLDGVSLVGAWYAVERVGDVQATRDYEDGTLETTLLVEPNGRAVLTGIDRREGDGAVTFLGQITTNRLSFEGMDGAGTLFMNGRRLVLRDPSGRRTVFLRGRR